MEMGARTFLGPLGTRVRRADGNDPCQRVLMLKRSGIPGRHVHHGTAGRSASSQPPLSRLDLILQLVKRVDAPPGFSVNIGCKETSTGDVNLDIVGRPDVKGSVLF